MRVTVLGSGSAGTATLIEADGCRIMIDAGFSGKDLAVRLESIEVSAASLDAILITHDHGDHTRGMGVLARRFGVPIYMTERTAVACKPLLNGKEEVRHYRAEERFRIGNFEVQPFLTVHDATDPVAITVRHLPTGSKMGVATDLGRPTPGVRAALAGCHLLVLEANHDDEMLWRGPYPWSVKQRIASSHGHLSNRASADLARDLMHEGLGGIVLAHLSEHCNDGVLAKDVVEASLTKCGFRGMMQVAGPARPLEPIEVLALRKRIGATSQQLDLL
jgi:phosphoribosyl 1,2-cyclic phosphodiesterase